MQNFLKILHASLIDNYSESEIRVFGYLILENLTGLSRTQLLVRKDIKLTDEQEEKTVRFLERLKANEPLQYILGETEFYGLKFEVNASVLIPRPETEELVEWASKDLRTNTGKSGLDVEKMKILDIGTGCGCIPIALKKAHPEAVISAMDVSLDALTVAKKNAELNQVEIEFIQEDISRPKATHRKWNVIVSNPPYIPLSEKKEMDKGVKDYEPHIALFSPAEKPLIFYHKIAAYALSHLEPNGSIYFETHKDYSRKVALLLGNYGFKQVFIRNDISGNERMVKGSLS